MRYKIESSGATAYLRYAVVVKKRLIMGEFVTRGQKCMALGASLKADNSYAHIHSEEQQSETYHYTPSYTVYGSEKLHSKMQRFGPTFENLYSSLTVTTDKSYIISSREHLSDDLDDFFYANTDLPIQKGWGMKIFNELRFRDLISREDHMKIYVSEGEENEVIPINGKSYRISDLIAYHYDGKQSDVEDVIEVLARRGVIEIESSRKEEFPEMDGDTYMIKYAEALREMAHSCIKPKIAKNGTCEKVFLSNLKLKPQQGVMANAIINHLKTDKSCFFIGDMGIGKTITGTAIVDGFMNEKVSNRLHKPIKEIITDPKAVLYRALIICPPHLVMSWVDEIERVCPYAKTEILTSVSQLVKIREEGKAPDSKKFYILSKDTMKTDGTAAPIPTKYGEGRIYKPYCKDCLETDKKLVYLMPNSRHGCRSCGGRNLGHMMTEQTDKGLFCHKCSKLLVVPDKDGLRAMTPQDFKDRKSNPYFNFCYNCGEALWANEYRDTKALREAEEKAERLGQEFKYPYAWRRIKHYKNAAMKSEDTEWALAGHEAENAIGEAWEQTRYPDGSRFLYADTNFPRKVAMDWYFGKYLRGYFDFCLLDEVHKFAGDSIQSRAAHVIYNSCRKVIGLTGTIANGKAGSFFNLFYMFCPHLMEKHGFEHDKKSQFIDVYGSKVKTYHLDEDRGVTGRRSSSGEAREKAGISPKIVTDFLIHNSVFLSITDFTEELPTFTEEVVMVPLEDEIRRELERTADVLKSISRSNPMYGMKLLSSILQWNLSYSDKPYGRNPIMDPLKVGNVLDVPKNFNQYENPENLLNKEKKLVELVKDELEQGRNCFVYVEYTSKDNEAYIQQRIVDVLQYHLRLSDSECLALNSGSPQATKRENWLRTKASLGAKVIVCNPRVVETGLDFIFKKEGKVYNYPTIINYQLTTSVSTLLQANRRAYRLIQRMPCKCYYFASEGTYQANIMEIAAMKVRALGAISGKFSSGGLAATAKGVDVATKLAEEMIKGYKANVEDIQKALNENNRVLVKSIYSGDPQAPTFQEVTGKNPWDFEKTEDTSIPDLIALLGMTEEQSITDTLISDIENEALAPIVDEIPMEIPKDEAMDEIFAMLGFEAASDEKIEITVKYRNNKKKRASKQIAANGNFYDL